MPEPRPFEDRLADALRRYSDLAPTEIDAMALARDIATTSPRALQRRPRWWPSWASTLPTGRFTTMFTPSRIAVAVSIITLGTGLALIRAAGPAPDPGPAAPVAEASFSVPEDAAFFSGSLTYDEPPPGGSGWTKDSDTGLEVSWYDKGQPFQTLTVSDPRLTGSRVDLDFVTVTGDSGRLWAQRSRIENTDGSWACVMTRLDIDAPPADVTPLSGWCDGTGAYDGYSALLAIAIGSEEPMSIGGPTPAEQRFPVSGFVFKGDPPLLPVAG
jgi:hypothetical protein